MKCEEKDEYVLYKAYLQKARMCSRCRLYYTLGTSLGLVNSCHMNKFDIRDHVDYDSETPTHISSMVIPFRIYTVLIDNNLLPPDLPIMIQKDDSDNPTHVNIKRMLEDNLS